MITYSFLAQFFAHTHKDDFRLQLSMTETGDTQQEAPKSFVLLAPAISPVYHNNPAFRVVSLETDQLVLLDYTQYYMDLVMATGEEYQCSLFPGGGGGEVEGLHLRATVVF